MGNPKVGHEGVTGEPLVIYWSRISRLSSTSDPPMRDECVTDGSAVTHWIFVDPVTHG